METTNLIKEYRSAYTGEIKLGFIGCGNMATAIIKGILMSKLFEANEILVSSRSAKSLEKVKNFGVQTTLDSSKLCQICPIVFLCVKPNSLDDVSENTVKTTDEVDYEENYSGSGTLISILAGTSIEKVKRAIPLFANYLRAMPNTPLQAQCGCTAITKLIGRNDSHSSLRFEVIKKIFGSLGIVEVVDESKFHAITALSGSGPAYVYIICEALSDAAVKQGLPRDIATKFAAQTLLGASKTILESGEHPAVLKDQVTSSGGTTIYGIHELERGGIRNTIFNAIEAATKRSMEM